jgi:adenylosuccinate lyase
MATENILMEAVKKGGDRQELHERIRVYSMAAAGAVKDEGKPNDLLSRITADPAFGMTERDIENLLEPSLYIGRSASQVEEFVEEHIRPITNKLTDGEKKVELKV